MCTTIYKNIINKVGIYNTPEAIGNLSEASKQFPGGLADWSVSVQWGEEQYRLKPPFSHVNVELQAEVIEFKLS